MVVEVVYIRKIIVKRIVVVICKSAQCIAHSYVRLIHTGDVYKLVKKSVHGLRRSIWVIVLKGIRTACSRVDESDEICFYHNFLAGLIPDVAFTVLLIEISENSVPCSIISASSG